MPRSAFAAVSCAALAALLIAPAAGRAQQNAEDEVVATVRALFDAMRARDSAAARAVFHPDARLVTTGVRDGRPAVGVSDMDGFIEAIGSGEEPWDERLYDIEVRVDGNLATLWARYEFYLADEFSHCGVDAFQLARTADGWKIIQVADTRRSEGCRSG